MLDPTVSFMKTTLSQYRLGFELEYQNPHLSSTELNEERANSERDDAFSEYCANTRIRGLNNRLEANTLSQIVEYLDISGIISDTLLSSIAGHYDEVTANDLSVLLRHELTKKSWLNSIEDTCPKLYLHEVSDFIDMDHIEENFNNNYEYGSDCYEEVLDLPNSLERVTDSTVSGGEIRPKSPLSYEACLASLKSLDNRIGIAELECDTECSFHVHLSIEGRTHSYGENMQYLMTKYIIDNLELLPTSCLERMSKNSSRWIEKYFNPKVSNERYCFVRFCKDYGSWEIRGFGNVQSQEEAIRCLDVAMLAYDYAYANVDVGIPIVHNMSDTLCERADAIREQRQHLELGPVLPMRNLPAGQSTQYATA